MTAINGDVVVNNFGNITAASGDGIRAFNYGIGDVTVNDDAGTIIAQGGANTTAGYGDGINASNEGTGNINVTTAEGTVIDSHLAGSGIAAINKAPAPSTSSVIIPFHKRDLGLGPRNDSVREHPDRSAEIRPPVSWRATIRIHADLVNSNVAGSVWIDDYATHYRGGRNRRNTRYKLRYRSGNRS